MRKLFWKTLLSCVYLLLSYQSIKHLYQDITGKYTISQGTVVSYGKDWEPAEGEGTLDPRVMLIVKLKSGRIESCLTRASYGVEIGDYVTCKLYGDVDPIIIKYKDKTLKEPIADLIVGFIKWLFVFGGTILFFTVVLYPLSSMFYKSIFQKKMTKRKVFFLFVISFRAYSQSYEISCSNSPYLSFEAKDFKTHQYSPLCPSCAKDISFVRVK